MVVTALLLLAAGLTSADTAPYLTSADARAGLTHYGLREYKQAAQKLRRYLDRHENARDAKQAELLYALSLFHDGDAAGALPRFERLATRYPLLAPYHHYFAARAAFEQGDFERTLSRAAKVAEDCPLHMDAMLLRGEALRARARFADAVSLYTAYLAKYPNGIRIAETNFLLAEALEKIGKPAGDLYMKVWTLSPLEWGPQAEAHLDRPAQKATAAQWITRATALFDAMRNQESENAYAAALGAPGLDPESECVVRFHRAQSVFKQRNRTRAAPLFQDAVTACAKTKNEDLKAKSLYQLARCSYSKGDYEPAAQLFLRVESEFPAHSYADDARLRAAEAYAEIKPEDPRIDQTLEVLIEKHPTGDMRQEALFRIAFRALRRGAATEALKWFDRALTLIPREDIWYAEGRTLYWKGRTLERQGQTEEALAAWESCVRTYPLSYYALLSLNRLREREPARMKRLTADLLEKRPPVEWTFQQRPLYTQPGFRRGVELARLSLGDEAKREFSALGIRTPGKGKVADPEEREQLWLAALLLDRASVWSKSHWIARHALEDDWHREWPRGAVYKKWLLAYPRAYGNILDPAARQASYPEDLLIAIAREESAFDPIDESFANAMGLLQMIIPTAKRFAQKGETVSRETLRDPVYNVKVGIRWLSFLWERYDHNPVLAAAGHNAGEGAVGRWLRERGDLPLDEWVETIPYDETRNYTKRVMSSYFTYRWLAAVHAAVDPVPVLPEALPKIKR